MIIRFIKDTETRDGLRKVGDEVYIPDGEWQCRMGNAVPVDEHGHHQWTQHYLERGGPKPPTLDECQKCGRPEAVKPVTPTPAPAPKQPTDTNAPPQGKDS